MSHQLLVNGSCIERTLARDAYAALLEVFAEQRFHLVIACMGLNKDKRRVGLASEIHLQLHDTLPKIFTATVGAFCRLPLISDCNELKLAHTQEKDILK